MNRSITFAAIVAAAGLAAPAVAQDSVSQNPGTFVGDALIPWLTTSQCADFVVDLTPIQTSGGTTFGIAPLLKSSKTSDDFFSSLIGPQSVSADEIVVNEFARESYNAWNFPGGGVNFIGDPAPNAMGQLITPTAEGDIFQFAAGFSEFATTNSGDDYEGVIGGVVNFDKANPSRLYVSRVIAATDRAMASGGDSAEFGFGTVDASGNIYFRADDFGSSAGDSVSGNNIFRVSLLGRDCDSVNRININGGADAAATERLVTNQSEVYSVPGNIPQSVAGRPVYVGLTFATQLAAETSPGNVTLDSTFLGGLATDTRGVLATYRADALGNGGVALGGNLSKSSGGPTDSISLFSLDANGNVIAGSQRILTLPGSPITDPVEGFTLSSNGEYDHYRSQTPFRGGNSQVALGADAQGNVLAAGAAYLTGGQQDPFNAIPVARLNPNTGAVEYSLAAWIDFDPAGPAGVSGKPVYDDAGNEIGELRPFIELNPANPGPSLSAPSIDGAGNVWFVGLVAFEDPDGGEPFFRTTLLRAVYQPNVGGGFGYRLEKVLAFADVVQSQNTGLDYFVGGFQIVDANSVNSSTLWSSNVKQATWGGIDASELDSPADPRSTAGVVIATSITYDVDQDGDFTLNTMDDPGTLDEAYNVLLYISNIEKPATADCPQDLDGSGVVDASDLAALISQWGQFGTSADFAGNGVGADDLAALVAAWGPCPQ